MSTINPNSLDGSVIAETDHQEIEEQTDLEPIKTSFIDIDILKELQRELHLLDVENEFDVKVILLIKCYIIQFKNTIIHAGCNRSV